MSAKPAASCGATPMPPSRRTISATAWCCSASSSPPRRTIATSWLRLAAHHAADPAARRPRAKRCCSIAPATAAYIAYQRAHEPQRGSRQPAILGRTLGRSAAVAAGARCAAPVARAARDRRPSRPVRKAARRSRLPLLDYTVDADSPRRAPASSSPKSCPASAPTSRRSSPSPAWTSPRSPPSEKQLCVEGLKHGERYSVTLRAGLPSTVKETLAKSAEFTIYVRDRKPFVRFSGKAYVLPRTGQRGIPVVSVNTRAVNVDDLPHRRPQPDRHACSATISSAT